MSLRRELIIEVATVGEYRSGGVGGLISTGTKNQYGLMTSADGSTIGTLAISLNKWGGPEVWPCCNLP